MWLLKEQQAIITPIGQLRHPIAQYVRHHVMKEEQIISWIFLAVALASNTEPSDIKGISLVADGINHAVLHLENLYEYLV